MERARSLREVGESVEQAETEWTSLAFSDAGVPIWTVGVNCACEIEGLWIILHQKYFCLYTELQEEAARNVLFWKSECTNISEKTSRRVEREKNH